MEIQNENHSVAEPQADLKLKLKLKIEELRVARKASQEQNRQELLEKRKKKNENKKSLNKSRKMALDTKGMAVNDLPQNTEAPKPQTEMMFGKIDFGKQETKSGPTDAAAKLKKVFNH